MVHICSGSEILLCIERFMIDYKAPISNQLFTFQTLLHAQGLSAQDGAANNDDAMFDQDLFEAIITEADKFACDVLLPLNRKGDWQGAQFQDGCVRMAEGFAEAYKKWCDAGWNSLSAPEAYGGQNLPIILASMVNEIWCSANMAFHLCPLLTAGAIDALEAHGSDDLKARYLEKMISGTYSGTMHLTEAQAGSDLRFIQTRAALHDDGHYRLFGQKIYITYGAHDMAENIMHLVLARIDGAKPGVGGLSLFLVPQILDNGDVNDVHCASIEHKLGIHASPTCTMIFGDRDGAMAYLIGQEHKGLAAMFTMMNAARLNVGLQGVALCERAVQGALAFACERKQGAGADKSQHAPDHAVTIDQHGDVQQMLMTMQSMTAISRFLCYDCALAMDLSKLSKYEGFDQDYYEKKSALLTPVAKAFSTDCGVLVSSLGIQVLGGMGYIEESGMAQLYRDARITPIYEGTNGIQALDLVTRKVPMDDGVYIYRYLDELAEMIDRLDGDGLGFAETLIEGHGFLKQTTDKIIQWNQDNEGIYLQNAASSYLSLFAHIAGGCYMAAAVACSEAASKDNKSDALEKLAFFCRFKIHYCYGYYHAVLASDQTK
jgi:acyl-CoA dehydrogenase